MCSKELTKIRLPAGRQGTIKNEKNLLPIKLFRSFLPFNYAQATL